MTTLTMVKTAPNLLGFVARLVCVFGAHRKEVSGRYRNGLLRIELVVPQWTVYSESVLSENVAERPRGQIETPVKKIGRDRFSYGPPGGDGAVEFTAVRDKAAGPRVCTVAW